MKKIDNLSEKHKKYLASLTHDELSEIWDLFTSAYQKAYFYQKLLFVFNIFLIVLNLILMFKKCK